MTGNRLIFSAFGNGEDELGATPPPSNEHTYTEEYFRRFGDGFFIICKDGKCGEAVSESDNAKR